MTQISLFSGPGASSSHGAAHPCHGPRGTFGDRFGRLVNTVQEWRERYRARRDLLRLSEYQLKDIGLSQFDAEEEYRKPFWRG